MVIDTGLCWAGAGVVGVLDEDSDVDAVGVPGLLVVAGAGLGTGAAAGELVVDLAGGV